MLNFSSPLRVNSRATDTGGITEVRNPSGVSFTVPPGVQSQWIADRLVYFLPAGTYTLSARIGTSASGFEPQLSVYTSNEQTSGFKYLTGLNSTGSNTFTLSAPMYVALYLHATLDTVINEWHTISYDNIQIEQGAVATSFAPFSGETYSVDLPASLYGCGLRWDSGWVERRYATITLQGNENLTSYWLNSAKTEIIVNLAQNAKGPANANSIGNVLCSHAKVMAANKQYSTGGADSVATEPSGQVLLSLAGVTDIATFKRVAAEQYAAGTPIRIAYEVSSPQGAFDVEPQKIEPSSENMNTLIAEFGTVTTDYVASGWKTVSDTEQIEAALGEAQLGIWEAQEAANQVSENLERRVRMDSNGVHVGDSQTTSELLLQSALIHFVINGKRVSTIASDYHRFGDMEIRTPSSVGGIVIQAVQYFDAAA